MVIGGVLYHNIRRVSRLGPLTWEAQCATKDPGFAIICRVKPKLPFAILFEDRRLVAIDKPCGLLSTHSRLHGKAARESQPTAENLLTDYLRKGQAKSRLRAWPVHRLDRETSGVLLFAKEESLAARLRENWNRIADKTYLARVEGLLDAPEGIFESSLRDNPRTMKVSSVANPALGKPSRTEWRRISTESGTTLAEVVLKSGRKNQIRVHFSEAGHPVVGDMKYGGRKASRLYLHAWKLRVRDAELGVDLSLVSDPARHGFR